MLDRYKSGCIGIAINLLLVGCGYYHSDYRSRNQNLERSTLGYTTLSFAAVKDIVLKENCYFCHSASAGNQGGVNLETYENVLGLVGSIKADVSSDRMPLGGPPVPSFQKQILLDWIQAGSPEQSDIPISPEGTKSN